MNNKLTLIILAVIGICSTSKAQSTYQKYDSVTRRAEYNVVKSQINSNAKTIDLFRDSKKNYSVFNKNDSITRSRIQSVLCAKENENFRLNQKAFLISDANEVDNIESYNNTVRNLRNQVIENK